MTAEEVPVDSCVQAQGTLIAQTREVGASVQSACSECKRRKQKCSRFWPCRHCGTRRVGNHCNFQSVLEIKSPEERQAQIRELVAEMEGTCLFSQAFDEDLDDNGTSTMDDLEALGYSSAHVVSSCSSEPEVQQV